MYILGCLRGDSVQKDISCGKMPHWTKMASGFFDFSHSKLYWLQPLQLEKGKEMHIFGASWKGLMVQKSHFVRFKKRNLRKEFFNQIKSVLLRNQLNFNFFLGTKSAAVRVKPYGNFWVVHAHTFCGRMIVNRMQTCRHFHCLFPAKKG